MRGVTWQELRALMARNGVNPAFTMGAALFTLPVWITFFFTMRMLERAACESGCIRRCRSCVHACECTCRRRSCLHLRTLSGMGLRALRRGCGARAHAHARAHVPGHAHGPLP